MGACKSSPPDPKLVQMKEQMKLISRVKMEIIATVSELENELKDIRLAMVSNENAIPEAGTQLHKSMRDTREKSLLNIKGLAYVSKDMDSLRPTYLQLNSSVSELKLMSSKNRSTKQQHDEVVARADPHGLLMQRNSENKLQHVTTPHIHISIPPMRVVDEDWLSSIHKVPQTLIIDPIAGLLNRATRIDNASDENDETYASVSNTDEYRNVSGLFMTFFDIFSIILPALCSTLIVA